MQPCCELLDCILDLSSAHSQWNRAIENRTVDRALHIGPTKPVQVERLVNRDVVEDGLLEVAVGVAPILWFLGLPKTESGRMSKPLMNRKTGKSWEELERVMSNMADLGRALPNMVSMVILCGMEALAR